MDFDVVILGGGPAGTAAAITLARAGLQVAILERSCYNIVRIGETLPPDICVPLQRLGVWERFVDAAHRESPGIVSCWGSAEPYEHDFLCNIYGGGWHVNRSRFDRMLADAAKEAGASVWLATTVKNCELTADGQWRVEAHYLGEERCFRTLWLIDAVGRTPRPGSMSTTRRVHYDRLIGIVTFLRRCTAHCLDETRTVIEAVPDGWWYSAPLPDNQLVIAFMTDADLVAWKRNNLRAEYLSRLQKTMLTRRWLETFSLTSEPQRCAANSYCAESLASCTRLAVGDAAMAFDPLSSQGILKALTTGQQAAMTVLAVRTGMVSVVEEYARMLTEDFRSYLLKRLTYYRAEQRWPHAPFWRRRQSPPSNVRLEYT